MGSLRKNYSAVEKRWLFEAPSLFTTRRRKQEWEAEALQAELYQQIGQLKVELDWVKKRLGTVQ